MNKPLLKELDQQLELLTREIAEKKKEIAMIRSKIKALKLVIAQFFEEVKQ